MINENSYLLKACRFLKESEDDELPLAGPIEGELDLNGAMPENDFDLDDKECEDGDCDDEGCVDCPDCGGTGTITDETGNEVPCETCGGEGCVDMDDVEFDYDPADGVCPCCGAHLNVIEPEQDSLAGEDDLDDELEDELDDLDDDIDDDGFDDEIDD